jgi:molybdopterin molybdotransferase
MGEFLKVMSYEEAVLRLRKAIASQQAEECTLGESSGRALSGLLYSPEDVPAFDRSTVDGYALRAMDSFGASEALPAFFQCVGSVLMGAGPDFELGSGECAWIPTGGMLPTGSDAALMVEYTEKLGDDTVLAYRPVSPGENVMLTGEDIRCGQVLFPERHVLRPQDIGLLASLGLKTVSVLKPYQVGIISSGDEVIPIESQPQPGQVRDVNSFSLAAAVARLGHNASNYPLVGDEARQLKAMVAKSLQDNDLTLLSGGSSVGIADFTLDVLLSFPDAELLFHGLAVKPGKPTLAVKINDRLIIGLPGHPVSALMMFHVVVQPLLDNSKPYPLFARLLQNIASQPGRDDFVPVSLQEEAGQWSARPLLGKSGLMGILSRADGYIHIGAVEQGLAGGSICRVALF